MPLPRIKSGPSRARLGRQQSAFLAQAAGLAQPPSGRVRARVIPITPTYQPTWTVSSIRGALSQHEQGHFDRTGLLWDAMGRDDRITPVLRHRTRGMLGMPFELPTADESAEAKEMADRWAELWPRFAPKAVLGRLLDDYIMLGVALAQISYVRVEGADGELVWEPRLHNEESQFLRYDLERRAYFYNTREEGEIEIIPGDGKWVLLESGERGYRNGAIRALALMWHIRDLSWFDWARYTERHGMPLLKALVPAEVQEQSREDFWTDIVQLGRESAVLLPQGVGSNRDDFDVQLLEAKDGNWKAFQELKADASIAIAVYLLGQNLTTEIQAGSYAAANVHKIIRNEVLQADEGELGDDLLQQAVKPISDLLMPNGRLIAPRPTWNVKPPADREKEAEVMGKAAVAAKALTDIGIPLDVAAYAKEFGIPLEDVELAVGQALFRYHLDFGILTVNEARARLGLDPIEGGDVRALPAEAQTLPVTDPHGGETGTPAPGDGMSANAAKRTLKAAGVVGQLNFEVLDEMPPATRAEFVEHLIRAQARDDGQRFNDGLAGNAALDMGRDLNARFIRPLIEALKDAETEEEIRAAILKTYGGTDSAVAEQILEELVRIGELNALHDVETEIGE